MSKPRVYKCKAPHTTPGPCDTWIADHGPNTGRAYYHTWRRAMLRALKGY